jgi:acyl phosphate:glycerol-3-phosphate acyltransferase
MNPVVLGLGLLLCYLLGSLSGSMLMGRLRGVDIRRLGSGNAGATNALRTQGMRFALSVALIDFGKGILAVLAIAPWLRMEPTLALLATVLGHCFPVFYGFRGGKGAGSALGGFFFIAPYLSAVALALWALLLMSSGYVGISTAACALFMFMAIALGEGALSLPPQMPKIYALLCLALVAAMHHGNLRRHYLGTESRFEGARLLRRLWRRLRGAG